MNKLLLQFLIICIYSTPLFARSVNTQKPTQLSFLENKGQWPGDILYQCNSSASNVYLLQDGLSFSSVITSTDNSNADTVYVWNMKMLNTTGNLSVKGVNGAESVNSYLSGNDPSKWIIHPKEYHAVSYKNVYSNTDLDYYINGNHLEYDYILHPGSDIRDIQSAFEGTGKISINSSGDLEITTVPGIQIQRAPVSWQIINGNRKYVDVSYILYNDSTFGFNINSAYDKTKDLIIDPLFQMVWSSFTKATGISNNINYCFGNAMDADGNVYLTGMVDGTFPTTPGAYSGPGSIVPEIFVAKFSSDGTTMLYSTYIPGTGDEKGLGIDVDNSGRAYITGFAAANFTGGNLYPTTPNAYQPAIYPSGGEDVVFSVLNSSGTGLDFQHF